MANRAALYTNGNVSSQASLLLHYPSSTAQPGSGSAPVPGKKGVGTHTEIPTGITGHPSLSGEVQENEQQQQQQQQQHRDSNAITAASMSAARPWQKAAVQHEPVCRNTCKHAKNGVCDDGRHAPGATSAATNDLARKVRCDLGTDCDDCGPWTPTGPATWTLGKEEGPITQLLAKDIEVRVKRTSRPPYFDFAYTDPHKDFDVSHHMELNGVVEAGITQVFYRILQQGCQARNGSGAAGLLVDVGANFGWFSLMAASMGCRVSAFEPVPHFAAFLDYSAHLNGLTSLIHLQPYAVSHIQDSHVKLIVPNIGIWGTAGIEGLNIDKAIQGSANEELQVPTYSLDQLVQEDVLVLKVDVEGWEWSVMQGATQLFKQHSVQHVIMEYSPGVPERSFRFKELKATIQMLLNLADAGYRIAHLGDQNKHVAGKLDADLQPYEEVTSHNLMYDLVDAHLFSKDVMGCPVPAQLQPLPMWPRCQAIPEDLSPRSLRSTLGHNTNVWAAKKGTQAVKLQPLQGHVGVFKLDAPFKQWFVNGTNEPHMGMGNRICAHLDPKVQVRHRCPCTVSDTCGTEESTVWQLVDGGPGMPSNYVLNQAGQLVSGTGSVVELFKTITCARDIGKPYLPGEVKGMLMT